MVINIGPIANSINHLIPAGADAPVFSLLNKYCNLFFSLCISNDCLSGQSEITPVYSLAGSEMKNALTERDTHITHHHDVLTSPDK